MMASMCLHMLMSVITTNAAIELIEIVLMTMEGVQTNIENEELNVIILLKDMNWL